LKHSVSIVSVKIAVLSVSVAVAVMIAYSLLSGGYRVFSELKPSRLAAALAVYMASWLITGVRLKMLHKVLEEKALKLRDYFYARLLGGFMAYLTPSAIGGEPARAYYIYCKAGGSYLAYLALTIHEVFYEIVVVGLIAIMLAVAKLPQALPVILVAFANTAVWVAVYSLLVDYPILRRGYERFSKIFSISVKASGIAGIAGKSYALFKHYFKLIHEKSGFSVRAVAVLLTILSNIAASTSMLILNTAYTSKPPLEQLLECIVAYHYSLAMGALPTPGGAGAVEYGLALVLEPRVVVLYRTLSYYSVLLCGLAVFTRISPCIRAGNSRACAENSLREVK